MGHSHFGNNFDTGPREKPWVMEGIGHSHLPITTSNPEVQKWFDQGNTLLHSFWFYEAERSFRWCLKLEPENAMAYWGMARSNEDSSRGQDFIKEAMKRKDKVTERERLYIESEAAMLVQDPLDASKSAERQSKSDDLLEELVLKYPDDIEAKALYGYHTMFRGNRLGADALFKQVLAVDPMHPGANHYRIHLWNYDQQQQGLDSCRIYGEKIAPAIGHAQHMPGHIYSEIGMWQEAAIAMDSATRVEKEYMRTRMIFPWDNWNYAHNADYLSFIQTHLGMAESSIRVARQLMDVSLDPQQNRQDKFETHWQGVLAMMRALLVFERWDTILDPKTFEWSDGLRDRMYQSYVETIAHLEKGEIDKAEKSYTTHDGLKTDAAKPENSLQNTYQTQHMELMGRLELAKGKTIEGLAALTDAVGREQKLRDDQDDPPFYPFVLSDVLGQAYLDQKSPELAVKAYQTTLKTVKADGFALAGLVQAYTALGEKDKAREAMGELLSVWSDADPGVKELEKARALVKDGKPIDHSPATQRSYRTIALEHWGPGIWEPYPAPALNAVDSKGKSVSLADYKGRNVILIFYLSDECAHCMDQLRDLADHKWDWAKLDTDVLAISAASPQVNAASAKLGDLPFRLLSDEDFSNARRFKSYDDFEDLALHSTILIDKQGRVHWARSGGDPFTDLAFLQREIGRMNAAPAKPAAN